jgi:GNAT superfamily N-acetyltransferase
MEIRLASLGERERLVALQWRASLANVGDREALLANPNAVQLPTERIEAGWVIVAEDAGRPTGFAVVVPGPNRIVELEGLFVEPRFWRRGIGRMLVGHCIAMAKQLGARSLDVVGNPSVLNFYKSCGFRQTGNVRTQFGMAIAMVLALE